MLLNFGGGKMKLSIQKIIIKDRIRKEFDNINELAESIKDLGLLQPILISSNNELIAGHRRILACKSLGYDTIECNVINPKDELNKLDMELAENVRREDFNPMELAEGLQKRKQLYEALHPETKQGIAGGLASGVSRGTKTDSVFVQEPAFVTETARKIGKSETFVKEHLQLNDIKEIDKQKIRDNVLKKSEALAKFRKEKKINEIIEKTKEIKSENIGLIEGDCLNEIPKLKDKSISCLIIDPPYGIDYQSNNRLVKYEKIENDNINAFDLLDKSLSLVETKMLDDSHIYIFTSWKVYEFVKPIISKYFEVKNCLIWNKNNLSMGDLYGNYAEKYEMIIFATKGNRILTSNKRPVNVLDFNRTANQNHPTEKPIDLLKELINNSTVEGETILDYFAGSGSTLIASKELNRKFIGIEKNKEYINIIKNRLSEIKE